MLRYRFATVVAAVAFTFVTPFASSASAASSPAANRGGVAPGVNNTAMQIALGSGFSGVMLGRGKRPGNPTSDHPRGRAVDYMVSSRSEGDRLAAYARANAKKLGVKYVLWRVKNHYDHVHVSFKK